MKGQAKNPIALLIFFLMTAFMQGCSVMPYQETSSCQYNNLGKCIPISDAYQQAIKKPISLNNSSLTAPQNNAPLTAKRNYQDVLSRKMQSIINSDEMPLLRPAVVRRVLVMPYTSKDSTIWSEARHLYYIEQTPKWLLDNGNQQKQKQDYLNL